MMLPSGARAGLGRIDARARDRASGEALVASLRFEDAVDGQDRPTR